MRKCFMILGCLLFALPLHAQLTFVVEELPANTPDSASLFLGADVNQWAAADAAYQFRQNNLGQYVLSLRQPLPIPFEYKLTRGSWEQVETDAFGHFISNRRYEGGSDTIYLSVMSWDDLPIISKRGWAILTIEKLPDNTPGDAAIFAVGSFNAWHPSDPAYKLVKQENETFRVSIPLLDDTTLYKFTRGSWETIEGRQNGRARVNRQLILGQHDQKHISITIESWEDLAANPINSYTLLLIFAAIQGLLLIFAINTLQNNNRAANRILSVLLLVLSIALAGRVSTYDREIFNWFPRLLLLPDFIYFLYAPIFLIYINRLLRLPSAKSFDINWWQFLPFLLQIACYLPLILMNKEAFISKVVDQGLKPFFAWSGGLALLYNSVYWFICHRTVQQYERESGESHAFESNLAFLRVVIWLKLTCLCIWGVSYIVGGLDLLMDYKLNFITNKSIDILWMVFSLTTFFLGYYTMRQPEIFKLPAIDEQASPEGQAEQERAASMNERERKEIMKKLEQLMKNNQPYRNPSLSLTKLAEMLAINAHSLSRVINEGYGINFNDFVNAYRIEEFKQLVQQESYQNYTLLAIAFTVGFNSKSAFNRSFKKLENCTPREYLKTAS